jgi:hypothetical protein
MQIKVRKEFKNLMFKNLGIDHFQMTISDLKKAIFDFFKLPVSAKKPKQTKKLWEHENLSIALSITREEEDNLRRLFELSASAPEIDISRIVQEKILPEWNAPVEFWQKLSSKGAKSPHNMLVREISLWESDLYKVISCDHIKNGGSGNHGSMQLSEIPENILSAHISTRSVFSHGRSIIKAEGNWKTPDLWLRKDASFYYIVEVVNANDTCSDIARKIETVICNSNHENHKIAGAAIVMFGKSDENPELVSKLQKTFESLFGSKPISEHKYHWLNELAILMDKDFFKRKYGSVDWERILVLSCEDVDWKKEIESHISLCLEKKLPILTNFEANLV